MRACGRTCACVCALAIVSAIAKRPVLPPCAVDGPSRNPRCYYNYLLLKHQVTTVLLCTIGALSPVNHIGSDQG